MHRFFHLRCSGYIECCMDTGFYQCGQLCRNRTRAFYHTGFSFLFGNSLSTVCLCLEWNLHRFFYLRRSRYIDHHLVTLTQ